LRKFRLVLIIITFSILNISCTEFETEKGESPLEEYPDQESWGNNIYFQRDGQRLAVLTAGYIAKYFKKKHTLLQEGVKVDFYGEDGELKSVLTSEEGKVFDERSDMVASGNVVVISTNGTTLYTEELHWVNKDGKIISEVPVKITTERDTLYGDTFRSDPDLINYEITNARGTSDKTISIDD
jgi:LPS export ABC transporter protein LptC